MFRQAAPLFDKNEGEFYQFAAVSSTAKSGWIRIRKISSGSLTNANSRSSVDDEGIGSLVVRIRIVESLAKQCTYENATCQDALHVNSRVLHVPDELNPPGSHDECGPFV